MVGVHPCTKEDIDKFYSPAVTLNAEQIRDMFTDNQMQCLDNTDWNGRPLELYGSSMFGAHRRLEILYLPCEMDWPVNTTNTDQCGVDLSNKTTLLEKL